MANKKLRKILGASLSIRERVVAVARRGLTATGEGAVDFTLAGGRSPLLCVTKGTQGSPRIVKWGFTLAEVLITLGVIGVVAAVTMPTLVTNIQERVRKEQVRTVKYKLTKATDKMNSLGKIKQYNTTMDFVNELKKHMSIAKICDNNELEKCWPSTEINAYSGSGTTLTSYNPKTLTTGQSLKALALSTKSTQTVGIVTGDGVPMLLVYSPSALCNDFDEAKTYTWSVEDGKPVTNATTNCVSAIFDINGSKGPNKIGQDVRTLNSIFGATILSDYEPANMDICNNMKKKYGFKYCETYAQNNQDYWVGAMYACDKLGLHLPSMQTLAAIANSRYGTTQIGAYTIYIGSNPPEGTTCKQYFEQNWSEGTYRAKLSDAIICGADVATNEDSALNNSGLEPIVNNSNDYWANSEGTLIRRAYKRNIKTTFTLWGEDYRNNSHKALCTGD